MARQRKVFDAQDPNIANKTRKAYSCSAIRPPPFTRAYHCTSRTMLVSDERRERICSYFHLRKSAAVLGCRGHAHRRVDGRGWGRAVRCTGGARVVLRATPAKPNPRIANGIALHLIDGHFGRMALHKLYETTALARGDLDVSDFTKSLEERTELIFCNVAGKTANKDRGVVRIRELVHGRGAVVAHGGSSHGWIHARSRTHGRRTQEAWTFVLGCSRRNAHGTVAAVNALHLSEGTLLVRLVGKADKTVATRQTADVVGHDLSRLARRKTTLEKRYEYKFIHFGTEVTNKNRILGAAVVTAIDCISIDSC